MLSEYKLRPRYGYCKCGHSVLSHKGTKCFIFFYSFNIEKLGECRICTCDKFEQEKERVIDGSES